MSSPLTDRTADAPMSSATLSRGLREGVEAVRASIQQLFAPHAVTISDVEIGDLGVPDEPTRHLGAAFDVEGSVRARLLLLVGTGDDERLTSALLRRPPSENRALDAEDRAAFSELANIVASSFLNGLARELRLRLVPSIPVLIESPLGNVIGSLRRSHGWAVSAEFTVALPSGTTKGLFFAAPELTNSGI